MTWLADIIGPILVALGGLSGLGALLLVPGQLRKLRAEGRVSEADAATRLSNSTLALLVPMQGELDRIQKRLEATTARADALDEKLRLSQTEVQDLRNQVAQMSKELSQVQQENARLRGTPPQTPRSE